MTTLDALPDNVGAALTDLLDGVWDGRVDPGLLERCRLRVCNLVGVPAGTGRHRSAPSPAPDDDRVVACLAFTEMWVIDPHAVTDEIAAAVREHLDDREVAAFTIALATIEAQARAGRALEALR